MSDPESVFRCHVRRCGRSAERAVGSACRHERGEESAYPAFDLVTDDAYRGKLLAGGIGELPVQIGLAGEHRARVAAAHGDDHVADAYRLWREDLGGLRRDV